MKINLLLVGFLLLIIKTNAQIGVHTPGNSYWVSSKVKPHGLKNTKTISSNRLDSIFVKNRPLFLQYIPERKRNLTIIFAANSFSMTHLNADQLNNEIDLERMRNHAKQLFFKMKMWRYFRE